MKNLFKNITRLFALSMVLILASCGKDDEVVTPDAPTVTVSSTQFGSSLSYEATAGEVVTFSFNITAPGGFNTYTVTIPGNTPFVESKTAGETVTEQFNSGDYNITTTEQNVGGDISIQIDVVDDNNLTTSLTLTLTVVSAPINSYTAVLLAAPLADDPNTGADERTSETFFSTNLGTTITAADVVSSTSSSADVDFGYAYISEANLGAPASYPSSVYDLGANGQQWGTLNDTKFRKTTITSEQFIGVDTWAQLEAAFDDGTEETGFMEGLAPNQVIAFQTDASKTEGSKKGLIIVKEIVGTFNENDHMTIEVLVQK